MLTVAEAIERVKTKYGEVEVLEVSISTMRVFDDQVTYYHVRSDEEGWYVDSQSGEVFTAKVFWRRRRLYDKHAW
jgi:hypothetical protein